MKKIVSLVMLGTALALGMVLVGCKEEKMAEDCCRVEANYNTGKCCNQLESCCYL
jgi:hypothetical protein